LYTVTPSLYVTRSATSSQCSSEWSRCVKPRSYFFVPLTTRAATRISYHTIPSLLGQKFSKSLPPTTEEVNAIAHDVCLSVSKITLKRVHVFRWHFACRQVWRHGQTDQVLNPIRIIVRMPEPDCVCTATRNFITSGKFYVLVLGACGSHDAWF